LNSKLNPGTYEIQFDAGDLPSGIYFYMMIADGFRETRRMVIIK
jgi:hypothetical protein